MAYTLVHSQNQYAHWGWKFHFEVLAGSFPSRDKILCGYSTSGCFIINCNGVYFSSQEQIAYFLTQKAVHLLIHFKFLRVCTIQHTSKCSSFPGHTPCCSKAVLSFSVISAVPWHLLCLTGKRSEQKCSFTKELSSLHVSVLLTHYGTKITSDVRVSQHCSITHFLVPRGKIVL